MLRLRPAIARGVQAPGEAQPGAGQQRRRLVRIQQARADLIIPCAVQPGGVAVQLPRGLGDIGDTGAAEAHVGADPRGHAVPHADALHRQRHLGQVAPRRAAPAPVAAGLLGADPALLQHRDGDALLRQRQCGADADDARADHHGAGAARQLRVGVDGVQQLRHRVRPTSVQAHATMGHHREECG